MPSEEAEYYEEVSDEDDDEDCYSEMEEVEEVRPKVVVKRPVKKEEGGKKMMGRSFTMGENGNYERVIRKRKRKSGD